MSKQQFLKPTRTEEVQAIIEKMPTRFGVILTLFISFLVFLMLFLSWIIRYPDIVEGEIIISSDKSPVKLVANNAGKIILNGYKSQDEVNEGDYIAYIQNSAQLSDVLIVNKILKSWNGSPLQNLLMLNDFPRNLSLGELNTVYFRFLNAFSNLTNYRTENIYDKQEDILKKNLLEINKLKMNSSKKLEISKENLRLIGKFSVRDSILFSKKVISESEIDKSKMNLIGAQTEYQNALREITLNKESIQETENKIQQNSLQKLEKEKSLYLEFLSSYKELEDDIKLWEQKYVFKAPMNGRVQFIKFWASNQYIELGEQVFSIVPLKNKIIGQMILPTFGSGKVKLGQEVIVKLEDYPYQEYGSLKGKVKGISLTSNSTKVTNGIIQESYLVNVDLINGLLTNYGENLDFKHEIKGTGEIVTKDRRLLERFFDNLKYSIKK